MAKKRNAPDSTLRNIQHANAELKALKKRVRVLEKAVTALAKQSGSDL